MAIGAILTIGAAIAGGAIASSGAKSAAKTTQAAQEAANAKMLEATTTNATRQTEWDKDLAQSNYETSVRATDMEYSGTVAGLNLQGRALGNLRNQTAASYNHEIAFTKDISQMELENALRTTADNARISTFMNVEGYKARKSAIQEALANEKAGAVIRGGSATRKTQEAKSQVAREADRASATARVAAGESGAAGSSMYTRMIVANASLEGEQMASLNGDLSDEFRSINHGLRIAASNATADLQMAELSYQGEALQIDAQVGAAYRDAVIYTKKANAEIENLVLQQTFDLQAIDLQGEGLNSQAEQAAEYRNFQMEMIADERQTSMDFADFIFDQTITSAEANASAGDALAAANASATKRMANTSFLAGVVKSGFDVLGDYVSNAAATSGSRSKLIN